MTTDPYSRPGDESHKDEDILEPLGADQERTTNPDVAAQHTDPADEGGSDDILTDPAVLRAEGDTDSAREPGIHSDGEPGPDETAHDGSENRERLFSEETTADRSSGEPYRSETTSPDRGSEDRPSLDKNAHPGGGELSATRTDAPSQADGEPIDSTQAWTPNYSDEEDREVSGRLSPEERARQKEEWDATFGRDIDQSDDRDEAASDSKPEDPTVVTGDASATTVGASAAGSAPTRTSVFQRADVEDAETVDSYDSRNVTATQTPAEPASTREKNAAGPFPGRPARRSTTVIPEEPKGRGWSHVGVFFATLILAPFTWYLMADSGARLATTAGTGSVDAMVILELVGALACIGILWFVASFSSVGASFFGVVVFVAGVAGIVAPGAAKDLIESSAVQKFAEFNEFTGNVIHHLQADLFTGRVAIFGFILLMTGVVSHLARRHGAEREEVTTTRRVLLEKEDRD